MATRTIDSVGVRSLATLLGAIGLLWGLIVAISWLVLGGPIAGRPGVPELLVMVLGGAIYGVVGGAVSAIVFNAAASLVGGLEIELS